MSGLEKKDTNEAVAKTGGTKRATYLALKSSQQEKGDLTHKQECRFEGSLCFLCKDRGRQGKKILEQKTGKCHPLALR